MGGCFSKKEKGEKAASDRVAHPEPEAPQEETVKEMLSEMPKPRPSIAKEEEEIELVVEKRDAGCYDERSEEASEICSLSESFSTTVTEKKGDVEENGEVRRRDQERSPAKLQRKRSFSGELSCKRERCGAAAGGGSARSSPSPARRREGGVGRTLSARETGRNRVGVRGMSVSPAAKTAAEQRCRVPAAAPEFGVRKVEDGNSGNWYMNTGKESLENPLVALECFIFL